MNLENKVKFYGEIIDNLKKELDILALKIKKARENNNFGTYKNLILAYKEILELYKDLANEFKEEDSNKERQIPIVYNIHVQTSEADSLISLSKQIKNLKY